VVKKSQSGDKILVFVCIVGGASVLFLKKVGPLVKTNTGIAFFSSRHSDSFITSPDRLANRVLTTPAADQTTSVAQSR
jgi:hypothetical protein